MIREINKKKYILENRKPYAPETAAYLREIWLSEWIYSSNKLDGCNLSLDETLMILKGRCIMDKTIEDHMTVRSHEEAIGFIEKMAGEKNNLFEKEADRIHSFLSADHSSGFRQNNPVVQSIHHIPAHFKEISILMEKLFTWYYSKAQDMNCILRGILLHNKLIEIYPYETDNEKTARALLNYELLRGGFPPIDFRMPNKTYHQLVSKYVAKQETTEFYELLSNILHSRLELFLRLTAMR